MLSGGLGKSRETAAPTRQRFDVTSLPEEFCMSDETEVVSQGEYEPSGSNTVVIGLALLFIGFAAGAIAAALMTPKTGKQMRRELKRKADGLRDRVEDWSEQAGDWAEKGSDLAAKASDWADAAKERVAPLAKKFRSKPPRPAR